VSDGLYCHRSSLRDVRHLSHQQKREELVPNLKAVLEFDYVSSGPLSLMPGGTLQTEYTPPAGWTLVGWGFHGKNLEVDITQARITADENDITTFYGTAVNTDTVNPKSVRYQYVLLKL
jgi:hypothetical protein